MQGRTLCAPGPNTPSRPFIPPPFLARMQIREAKSDDAAGIAAVIHAMAEIRSVAEQPIETTARTIASNLARTVRSQSSTAYVAEEAGGRIVGYGAVHWVPFLFLPGGEAYVTELFVRPADAGRGAGSKLLDTIVLEAKRRGCARVSLLNGRNVESYRRNFYKARGWVERDGMANFVLTLPKEGSPPTEPR